MRRKSVEPIHIYNSLKVTPPQSKCDLRNYVRAFLGVDVPDVSYCEGHSSPMDYLWHSYSCDFDFDDSPKKTNGDCVVWAGRGGGKTYVAAIATLLDCVFKSGCQTRILAGSELQASRLYDYLVKFIDDGFREFLAGPIRASKCKFKNEACVEVLTQSASSVRGSHIHKLRCDEIELFGADVFAAAKFVTQSTNGISGAMEIISTMHKPYGIMHDAVEEAAKNGTPIFKWCIWEVVEKCVGRSCGSCELFQYCQGVAKNANGYLKIDDCITQLRRSSRGNFESEVLCKRPTLANVVFDEFEPDVHVGQVDYDSTLPLYRTMDFGFVNPFVCLWIQVDGSGTVRVIDEYYKSRRTVAEHAKLIFGRTVCEESAVAGNFCDPAGAGRNDVTGTSPVTVLRGLGMNVRYCKSSIADGIELVRRTLRSGDGKSKMIISPRCGKLIEAMTCYHYADDGVADELPEKDGIYDHPIDALRYFFVNYVRGKCVKSLRY